MPKPRPPHEHTPIDGGTPTDGAATPTSPSLAELAPPGDVAERLPRPPAPRPPRLPAEPAARPGRRTDTPSDMQMTRRIPRVERVDPTPAPLPPSPGARDAERWFEQVPTNPAHVAALAESTGSHRKAQTSSRLPVAPQDAPLAERPWVLPALIAAIALTIGMILGGLLFGGHDTKCAPCAKATPLGAAGDGSQPKQ